jgi:hypothetical protein
MGNSSENEESMTYGYIVSKDGLTVISDVENRILHTYAKKKLKSTGAIE